MKLTFLGTAAAEGYPALWCRCERCTTARERGYDVQVGKFAIPVLAKAQIVGATEGMVKVVSDKKYDEVLGLHIIGPSATEMIVEGGAALQMEATVAEMIHMIHAHPTVSESIHEAFEDAHGMVIHGA